MNDWTPLQQDFDREGHSASCPVLDTHGHYGPWYGIYFPHAEAPGMLKDMDRAGVRLIVCSAHAAIYDPPRGNEEMRRVVERHPGRFLAYWAVSPHRLEGLEADLAALPETPEFAGIKLHPGMHQYPLDGDKYRATLEWATAHRYPVLTHTWGQNPHCSPAQVRAVLERHPEMVLLMGHSCYGEWEGAIRIAAEYPDAYLELTGTVEISGLVEQMVREAGANKILFGTDLPWFDPHYGIGVVVWSHLTDEQRRAILYENAERVFAPTGKLPARA